MQTAEKICFFNSCKAWGGGEKWHLEMAGEMKQQQTGVILFAHPGSELYLKAKSAGIPVYGIKVSNFTFLNIFKQKKLAAFLKKEKVTIIILNLPSDLKFAGWAAKKAGINKIIYRRGSAIPVKNSFLNRRLFRKIVTGIIANSHETKNTITRNNARIIDPAKISVIYNGIDLKTFDSQPVEKIYQRSKNEIILGNAGRLNKQKNQKFLIDIASSLKEKDYHFRLLIAGKGELLDELKAYSKTKNVEEHIVFMGFLENIRSFMKNIDIFLFPSFWEGFGYSLVEAMLCEKPVIAFNTSSNPEIVSDKETGFLTACNNQKEFTERTVQLIENAELRHSLGKKGRQKAEELFTLQRSRKEFMDFLKLR